MKREEMKRIGVQWAKELGKSVFTTGVAATTLFSTLAGRKAQAEKPLKDAADPAVD